MEVRMEPVGWTDWLLGGLAIAILIGGLVMLFSGVAGMNREE